jgi:hypothetical protein
MQNVKETFFKLFFFNFYSLSLIYSLQNTQMNSKVVIKLFPFFKIFIDLIILPKMELFGFVFKELKFRPNQL